MAWVARRARVRQHPDGPFYVVTGDDDSGPAGRTVRVNYVGAGPAEGESYDDWFAATITPWFPGAAAARVAADAARAQAIDDSWTAFEAFRDTDSEVSKLIVWIRANRHRTEVTDQAFNLWRMWLAEGGG